MSERLAGKVPVFFEFRGQIAEVVYVPRSVSRRLSQDEFSSLPDRQTKLPGWVGSPDSGLPKEDFETRLAARIPKRLEVDTVVNMKDKSIEEFDRELNKKSQKPPILFDPSHDEERASSPFVKPQIIE